jgi:DNA-binding NarL/FixJ family response regulator
VTDSSDGPTLDGVTGSSGDPTPGRVTGSPGGLTLVVADEPHARTALRLLLRREPGILALTEVGEASEVVPTVQAAGADVLLLDWRLRGLPRPGALVSLLRALAPSIRIVALGLCPDDLAAARTAGVDAVVCKAAPPEELLAAVRALAARES